MIIGVFVLYAVGLWGWQSFKQWQGEKKAEEIAQKIKQLEQEDYKRAMADTYGGKTPQETLQMYIDAVEKGDYELASKYFIGDYQEMELRSFENSKNVPKEIIENYIQTLKSVVNEGGKHALDGKYFSFDGQILIRMKLYPNGIWKIIEI